MSHYRAVVRSVERRMQKEDIDAYTACLAGWCCYALDRLDDAANYYSAALTMSHIGPAAELDYALILLSQGCHADARNQYERILGDLGQTNPLRRGGLLYVALFDLRDAARLRPQLDAIPETAEIRRALLHALASATDEYQQAFPELAGRLREYVDTAARELAAARPASRPGPDRPSSAAEGIAPSQRTSVAFVTPGAVDCALLIPALSPPPDGGAVPVHLDRNAADSADHRVLYLTEAFLEAVGASRTDFPLDSLTWQKLDTPAAAWAAWTAQADGARILNSLAVRLVRRAATHLARHGHAGPAESQIPAARAADLAAKIASDESLLYQAALLRTAAGAVENADVPAPPGGTGLQDLARDADGLRREARRRYTAVVTRHQDSAQGVDDPQVRYVGGNDLVKAILSTATKIAQIHDPHEQARQARYAAEQVEALAPLHDLAAHEREQVHQRLASHDRFYLESDASILVLAHSPAFYSSNVLLNLTKPAVNCFAFATASRRFVAVRSQSPPSQVRLKP
jgi:hypothetical protein